MKREWRVETLNECTFLVCKERSWEWEETGVDGRREADAYLSPPIRKATQPESERDPEATVSTFFPSKIKRDN